MKLKNIFKFATIAVASGTLLGVTSCNYLDVVPPEQPGLSDAMKNHTNAQGFLYSCYNKVSVRDFSPRDYRSPLNAANDEYLIPETWYAIDGPTAYAVMRNTQQSTATSYDPNFWNQYYDGIGQTLLFDRELDSEGVKNNVCTDAAEMELWHAESRFCRAFYHFQLLRLFGPVPITTKLIDMNADTSEYPGRVHVDGVVNWLDKEFTEIAQIFEKHGMYRRDVGDLNRANATICYALLSRLHLISASPLFNGEFPYRTWTNKTNSVDPVDGTNYGRQLVSDKFNADKWLKAVKATQKAIDVATGVDPNSDAMHRLYTIEDAASMDADEVYAEDINIPAEENLTAASTGLADFDMSTFKETVRMLRYLHTTTVNEGNAEIIWANNQVVYGLTDSRLPRRVLQTTEAQPKWKEGWNGVSPTLFTVEHFLTANGLTPGTDASTGDRTTWYTEAGLTGDRKNVLNICLNREPRFYAWIGFDGGDYLTLLNNKEPKLLNMRDPEMQGRGQGERNYSVTGFLSMKHVDPLSYWTANDGRWTSGKNSPDVLFRLAELYLNMAECFAQYAVDERLNEGDVAAYFPEGTSSAQEAAIYYVNLIRERAYVAPLTSAMCNLTDENGKKMDIRQWVRNERFVEMWDEGQRFFDVRRWVAGDEYFSYGKRMGLNGLAVNPKGDFTTPIIINSQYTFHKRQYLWPIYQSEVYNNPQMVQTPGY